VCSSTQTQTLTVVACVILQCIPCFYECRYMPDGVLIQFACQVFIFMVIQIQGLPEVLFRLVSTELLEGDFYTCAQYQKRH